MASQIQREARYPLEVFRTLPTQGWSEELQRFFDQIKSGANALSGMDFFIVTRKLLFAMAGTLITYELVLLQFNSTEIDKEHLVNCNKTFKLWNVLVDVFSLSDFVNKYFLRSNHKLFIANLIVRKSWELLSRTTLRKQSHQHSGTGVIQFYIFNIFMTELCARCKRWEHSKPACFMTKSVNE